MLLVGLLFNIETGPPPLTETEMMKKTFPNRFLGPIKYFDIISLTMKSIIIKNVTRLE